MKKSYEESKEELNKLFKLGKIDKTFYDREIKKLNLKIKQKEERERLAKKEEKKKKLTIILIMVIIIASILSLTIFINGRGMLLGKQYEMVNSFENMPVPSQKRLRTEGRRTVKVAGEEYKVKLIYEYTVYGRVVGTLDYDYSTLHGSIVPKDVGLVYGPLVQNQFLKYLDFESKYIESVGRVLMHRIKGQEGMQVLTNMGYGNYIANNHILGCDDRVNELIDDISVGDYIKLEGYLCEVSGSYDTNISSTKTSKEEYTIIESDYEGRANNDCETIYVTDVKWLKLK